MKYFKNSEIVNTYNVSKASVSNWIKAANEHKLGLELIDVKNKKYILDNAKNGILLKELSSKGKKFKNRKSLKKISPSESFYNIFNYKQVIEIINNLEIHKEIPNKYSYFNVGAGYWDEYINRQLKVNPKLESNYILDTTQIVTLNLEYIKSLVSKYDLVNIVDIGVGNGIPIKELLNSLISIKKLNKYIGIDYSKEMLEVAKNNISNWFGEQTLVETHLLDFNYERFHDIVYANSNLSDPTKSCINLFIFLGSTIATERTPYQTINIIKSSMGKSDILFLGQRLDTNYSKVSFDVISTESSIRAGVKTLDNMDKWILDLMNISDDLYDVEEVYSEAERSRFVRIQLKIDIVMTFFLKGTPHQVAFNKGERIILWRYRHQTYTEAVNEMSNQGFNIIHTSTSLNNERILIIARQS